MKKQKIKKIKLNNCPFCGSIVKKSDVKHESSQNAYFVLCWWCGAQGPIFGTKEEAIKTWNKRYRYQQNLNML